MKNALWIGHGHLVLPDGVIENGSLLTEDGKITALCQPAPENAQCVDAQGGYILSGFIDLHVHGGGDGDFMDITEDAFEKATRTHMQHGTTALVATTMTCPDALLEQAISCFLQCKKHRQDGAQLLGLHLEGPFFSSASKGAQPVSEQRTPTRDMLEHMIRLAEGSILRWDMAPELPNMELFAQVMKENGILAAVAHTAANAETAMRAFDAGFSHTTHFYNAMTTFHKENGIVHAGVIEATYLRDDVTIELIGDGRHIPKESMQLAYRIKGADRIALITDAMRAAGTNDVHSILGPRVGGVPVVVKDDVAQLEDFSSYAGSVCTMDRALRTAHVQYGLPLHDVSRMLSLTPARLCGVEKQKGSLEIGKDADIVLMDKDFQVKQVFIAGQCRYQKGKE